MAAAPCPVWLVINPASGSNDPDAVDAVRAALVNSGHEIAREICFPDEPLPLPQDLRENGCERVAIYTGDGSINATVERLEGWEGEILVLPGGTMNLLSKRLHGDVGTGTILSRLDGRQARSIRPFVIATRYGTGLSGVLVGPGAVWSDVREAMRDGNVVEMAEGAAHALGETTAGPQVRCDDPAIGRQDGYPLLLLSPTDQGMAVSGYYADGVVDFVRQAAAIAARDFRNGPHEELGMVHRLRIASVAEEPIQLLIDGEPHDGGTAEEFVLVECGVDLIATRP